jgi:hypothetical protein
MVSVRRFLVAASLVAFAATGAAAQDAGMKKWVKGKGWGWVWGPQDEVGNLNEMTDATRLAHYGSSRRERLMIWACRMTATRTSGRATAPAR